MNKYIVKKGDTLSSIAGRFNLTINDIISVNDRNLYELKEGDIIDIPLMLSKDFIYYTVENDINTTNLSKELGIEKKVLETINGFKDNEVLKREQVLIIPKSNVKIHITEEGDSLYDLVNIYDFKLDKLLEDNTNIYLTENQLLIEREKV